MYLCVIGETQDHNAHCDTVIDNNVDLLLARFREKDSSAHWKEILHHSRSYCRWFQQTSKSSHYRERHYCTYLQFKKKRITLSWCFRLSVLQMVMAIFCIIIGDIMPAFFYLYDDRFDYIGYGMWIGFIVSSSNVKLSAWFHQTIQNFVWGSSNCQ